MSAKLAAVRTVPTSFESEQIRGKIKQIDLTLARQKMMKQLGWTQEKCDQIETEYKAFIYLNYVHPQKTLVPSHDVDQMWHAHILQTRKYQKDCMDNLGFFMHHTPYDGTNRITQEDREFTRDAYNSLSISYDMPAECSGDTTCDSGN